MHRVSYKKTVSRIADPDTVFLLFAYPIKKEEILLQDLFFFINTREGLSPLG